MGTLAHILFLSKKHIHIEHVRDTCHLQIDGNKSPKMNIWFDNPKMEA